MLNSSVIVFFSWLVSAYAVLLATARASIPHFAQIQFYQVDQKMTAKLSKKIENYTSWDVSLTLMWRTLMWRNTFIVIFVENFNVIFKRIVKICLSINAAQAFAQSSVSSGVYPTKHSHWTALVYDVFKYFESYILHSHDLNVMRGQIRTKFSRFCYQKWSRLTRKRFEVVHVLWQLIIKRTETSKLFFLSLRERHVGIQSLVTLYEFLRNSGSRWTCSFIKLRESSEKDRQNMVIIMRACGHTHTHTYNDTHTHMHKTISIRLNVVPCSWIKLATFKYICEINCQTCYF